MLKVGTFCLYLVLVGGLVEGRVYDTDALSLPARLVEYLGEHPEILEQLQPPRTSLSEQPADIDALCTGCLTGFNFLKSLILVGVKWPGVRNDIVAVCKTAINANGWHGDIVCPGVVDSIGPLVYDAVKVSRKSAKKICVHMNWCDPYEAPSFFNERPRRDLSKAYMDKLHHILDGIHLDNIKRSKSLTNIDSDTTRDTEIKSSVPDLSLVPHGLRTDDLPMISAMLKDLHMDGTVFSQKLSDIVKLASSPENWKKKLPLKKLQALSKHLDEQLKEAMLNVEAKDKLKPDARKMANLIANALTRTTRRAKRQLSQPQSTANYMKVLQLNDIHVEVDYHTGAATDCGLPVCCRSDFPGSGAARVWGEWNCDTSPDTVRKLFKSAASHNPDFVIYSGDNPAHTVWMETLQGQLNASRWVARELAAGFPNLTVYPNIGNHENYPLNMYHVPREETQTLNREWANMFKGVANFGEDQLTTINKAGYYTTLVKPGLRVLAFNSNYGGVGNFLNILNYDRPEYMEMLVWMEQTLSQARNASERVFLLSHHEYGMMEMVVAFDEAITPILVEYSDIIMWHPVGHVHRDEFRINFDPATGLPVGVVFEAMSINTYPDVNPGYRVWYFDPDTYQPMDYEQYNIDLRKANENPDGSGIIHLAYKASDEYGLDDLSPASMLELYERIMSNDTLLQRYWSLRRSGTGADGFCDEKCKMAERCHIIAPTYDVYRACMRTPPEVNGTLYGSNGNGDHAKLWDHPEGKMAAFGSSGVVMRASGVSFIFSLVALTFTLRLVSV